MRLRSRTDDREVERRSTVAKYDDRDFVFSLARPLHGADETPIEYMVLDQATERIADFACLIDEHCIRAEVPVGLRKYTSNSDSLVVLHCATRETLGELIDVLRAIFRGKAGLKILAERWEGGGYMIA